MEYCIIRDCYEQLLKRIPDRTISSIYADQGSELKNKLIKFIKELGIEHLFGFSGNSNIKFQWPYTKLIYKSM